ncbi:DUF2806 domain-containing protein [Uliginosibacterium sp. 31-12]|uniref:DUF2806 domain-containing protein n=1 Tax=Uliginosibacterium sp. 31-12 TaxID=3062781 RepID=UPI0026E36672|nr:DUF2806 domain-containing protein [Uliginosibacterium sp. 31-12]MDO6385278.1 DUF2806 domain-containing protein [Uliginosibacterium sp. 31-12]
MDIKILDLNLKSVAAPTRKLIEVISKGMGAVYEPIGVRREADAEAYKIRALAAAKADALKITSEGKAAAENAYKLEKLTDEEISLHERARLRLIAKEIEGQKNIEAIVDAAFTALPSSVSDQDVSDDWRRKFFQEAENICDEDLQIFWAKLLAGEVASPGSFSLRTLDVLKQLSQDEAASFVKLCRLAMSDGTIPLCGRGLDTAYKAWGVSYEDILSLRDAGLLLHEANLHNTFYPLDGVAPTASQRGRFGYNGYILEIEKPYLGEMKWEILGFTRAGRELQNLVPVDPDETFLRAFAAHLRVLGVTLSRVLAINAEGNDTLSPPY